MRTKIRVPVYYQNKNSSCDPSSEVLHRISFLAQYSENCDSLNRKKSVLIRKFNFDIYIYIEISKTARGSLEELPQKRMACLCILSLKKL